MAPVEYIRILSPARALLTVLTASGRDGGDNGLLYVAWKIRVNDAAYIEFELNAHNPDAAFCAANNIVELWRYDRAVGLAEYKAAEAIIQDDQPYTDDQGRDRLIVMAYGTLSLLGYVINAYPAETSGRTAFGSIAAESLMKTLVTYNATASAVAAPDLTPGTRNPLLRDVTPAALGISVESDLARGSVLAGWACTRTNVLAELQKIADVAGGDFDLVWNGSSYVFTFYPGQRGTDRHTGIIFSLDRGNMRSPKLYRKRSTEKTVAIIGGSGDKDLRTIAIRTGPNYSSTNYKEMFVDGRNSSTTSTLNAIGDQALADVKFRNVLEYQVLQTPLYTVGKDYFLGDLVTAIYNGVTVIQQVYELTFSYENGAESVDVVMRDR